MSNFVPTMDKVFIDAMYLWSTVPPYKEYPVRTITDRLLPAIKTSRIKVYYDQDQMMHAFATWGFMTDREFESRDYSGEEVFSRNSGDKLVVVDMIAPGGINDVLFVARDLRKFFNKLYPHITKAYAHRGGRNGVFLGKGD